MQFEYLETNGIRLHAAVEGDGAAMLLLHGFPEFWYSWRRIIPAFASSYRVTAPDLRGYNLSDKPEGVASYGIRTLVEDVAGLIQEPVTLVGHDWGGAIAWVVAAFHPEKVERLIILNGPHPSTFVRDVHGNAEQAEASQYMLRLRAANAEQALSENGFAELKRSLAVPSSWPAEEILAYETAWSRPGALTAMLNYYRASSNVPGAPAPAKIPRVRVEVPTLVVWGEQDHALRPGLLEGLEEYVPRMRVHRIPHATHWVHHDAPQEVIGAMRSFLETPCP